jgi:hypothetical protein
VAASGAGDPAGTARAVAAAAAGELEEFGVTLLFLHEALPVDHPVHIDRAAAAGAGAGAGGTGSSGREWEPDCDDRTVLSARVDAADVVAFAYPEVRWCL